MYYILMKVFVSIAGINRCLPIIIKNFYENVIQTSPSCDFYVYVSLAPHNCESVKRNNRDIFELKSSNEELIHDVYTLFNNYNIQVVVNIDDIQTTTEIEPHEAIIFTRHSKNIERCSSNGKFDTGILMRTDTFFAGKYDISLLFNLCKDVMVIQRKDKSGGGFLHNNDWDHCFISIFSNIELLAIATNMMYAYRDCCLYLNELTNEKMNKYGLTSGINTFLYAKHKMPSKVPDIRFIYKKGQVKRLWMWLLCKNDFFLDFNIGPNNNIFIKHITTQDRSIHGLPLTRK
jgi:hypothetical protein